MNHYNYLVVALENLPAKKRWEIRVLNVNVDTIFGENYNQKLSDKWIEFIGDVEAEFGVMSDTTPEEIQSEQIVFSSNEIDYDDFPKVIRSLAGFWKRAGFEVSGIIEKEL